MTPPVHRDLDGLVPPALREAVARGWRGLTIVTGRAADRPVALVRADGPAARTDDAEQLLVGVSGRQPGAHRLVLRLSGHDMRLALDLRLAGVRALVRALAGAETVPLIELSPSACRMRVWRIAMAPAAELLRSAGAQAGEWHTSDPGAGLASSVRWQVDADRSLPRLLPGTRLGDPPVLAVPAGGRPPTTTARGLADVVPSELPEQARHLGHARATGRLTIAEVALGEAPVVTALRTVAVDPA